MHRKLFKDFILTNFTEQKQKMSRPASRAASRPPSRQGSRAGSRAGSRSGSSRASAAVPGPSLSQELQVNLKDCENLIRHRIVGLPGICSFFAEEKKCYFLILGGLTKSGHPLIKFPNNYRFNEVLESDLHLLLKYYVSVIPKNEQVSYNS